MLPLAQATKKEQWCYKKVYKNSKLSCTHQALPTSRHSRCPRLQGETSRCQQVPNVMIL